MAERTRFVGLDVHTASITVAVAEAFGDPEDHGQVANDPSAVRRLVQRLGGPDLHLEVASEAGPTGYVLHRQLTAMGIACMVVAPSLIPTKPGDRIKTDQSPLMSSRISISSSRCERPIASSLTAAWSGDAMASRVGAGGGAPMSDGAGRVGTGEGAADQ